MTHAAILWDLFVHCLTLSLLAIGGAIATVPDLQRHVVLERGWLSAGDFTGSVALAQAAPGPNLLFVAVVGYNVAGLAGALAAMAGMLLPSTALTLMVSRWGAKRRDARGVRTFVSGMAPVTLGLILATGYLLAKPVLVQPAAFLLVGLSVLLCWRTKLSPLWLIATGAVAGALGLV
ncbi:MAG: chromate transporter [Burkholderiales bacterium]|nr:chromate transporter [Burkholderiales bacterium]